MTLYTQVSANRHKSWLYLLIYTILLLLVGWVASLYFQSDAIVALAAVIVIIQGLVSYQFSDKIALTIARAEPLERPGNEPIYKIVENLTITAGLPMPKLYIIPDGAMNAFATGRDPQNASLALTAGLIQKLNDNELAGVIAHELSHVGNEDIRLMSLVMVLAGLITLLSHWMLRSMFWGGRRRNNDGEGGSILMVVAIILAILAPIAAMLIQLAISRKREFMADANAVLLTRYPEGLISALEKLGGDTQPLEEANGATSPMYIVNPFKSGFWNNLFSTHPKIEDRVRALRQGGGIDG